MKGYVFITSSGYDPEKGKQVKDPYLGNPPTLGACMPNIRRMVIPGDHIFIVSGKVPAIQQYIIGGFQVAEKISALAAYHRYPQLRLREGEDGQVEGNVIVDSRGGQHPLDTHSAFERRIKNYVIGRDPVALTRQDEINRGRAESLKILRSVLRKDGKSMITVMGRCSKLNQDQIRQLRQWLASVKAAD